MNLYIFKGDLSEWPTGCGGSASLKMSPHRKAESPVVVQVTRLDVSGVFSLCWNPEESGSKEHLSIRINGLVSETKGEQAKKQKLFPSHPFI